jgi:hypothetical protein
MTATSRNGTRTWAVAGVQCAAAMAVAISRRS